MGLSCLQGGKGGEGRGGEGRGGEGRSGEERGEEGRGEVGRRGKRREGASDRPGVREGSLQYALYVKYICTYVKGLTTISIL